MKKGRSSKMAIGFSYAAPAVISLFGLFSLPACKSDSTPLGSGKNKPPVIVSLEADPYEIAAGWTSTITAEAYDPDGDEIEYNWNAGLGYLMGSGRKVYYSAASCCVGENAIILTVSDERGGVAHDTTFVIVW